MYGLTVKEEAAIEELRGKIGDIFDELDDFHKHSLTLLRFLRARDMNVTKAEEMLRTNIKWRKENKIEEIFKSEHSLDLQKRFPFKISGYDSEGSYISVATVGKFDYRSIIENGEKDEFEHYMKKMSELTYELLKFKCTKDNYVTSAVAIVDYEGFNGLRQLTSPETMQFMQKLTMNMQNNYPEIMKSCWVVNAPKLFQVVFTMVKPILSKATLEKIHVYGSNSTAWKEALLKIIPPDQLPSQYGGSNTSCMDYQFEYGLDVTPRLPILPLHEMKTEVVGAGQKYQVDTQILKEGTELQWNFKTDDYDIGFSVFMDSELKEHEQLIPPMKCDAHLHVQKGKFLCTRSGTYSLVFDNSYSKFRSKTLYYVIKEEVGQSMDQLEL